MDDKIKLILILGGSAAAAALIGLLALQTLVSVWLVANVTQPDLVGVLEEYIDMQQDAGFVETRIEADDPLLENRKVLLNYDINARTAHEVASRLVYLNSRDGTAPIDLFISTQGGWVDNAFTIIDVMRTIEAPVNTWAVGGCYSAGALILTAGTGTRYATDNSIIMIHANLESSGEPYTFPRLSRRRYERVWKQTSSLPEDWYPMTEDETFYLSPQEALDFGIVDEIVATW